jgi:hypothetical protein
VVVSNGDTSIQALAEAPLAGTVWHILPHNSYFLIPDDAIRKAILSAHPELEAVSIAHSSLTALTITVTPRIALARWCGASISPNADCYLFDSTGFIYSTSTPASATSTPLDPEPLSNIIVYAPLAGSSTEVIGQSVVHSDKLPAIFQFSRDLAQLGAVVKSAVLRADEVDLFIVSGTRITYVLGDEQNAFTLATAAFPQANLADGSVDYIDLRFTGSGRVYLKKK